MLASVRYTSSLGNSALYARLRPDNQIDKYDRKLIAVGTRLNIIDADPPRHPFPSYRSVHREQQ